MKLRQLMVSSLPRMRVRKKKQPPFQVLNNETQQNDRNCNNCNSEMSPDSSSKGGIDIVKNVCFRRESDVSSGNVTNTTTSGTSSSSSNNPNTTTTTTTSTTSTTTSNVIHGCSSRTENKCHAIDCIDVVNFNVNIRGGPGDNKCACCDKHISQIMASSSSSTSSSSSSSSSHDAESTDNDENSSTSGSGSSTSSDKQNIPKTRSRIRTNPWLPSPRPTPSTSPTYSSSSSSLTSHSTTSPMVSPHVTKGRYSHPAANAELKRITDTKGGRVRPDRTWTRKFVLTNLNAAIGGGGNGRPRGYYLSDSDEQSPIGDKNGSITEEEDDGYFDHRISFEYEETLENLLEGDTSQVSRNDRYLSIQDLLSEENARKRRSTCSEFSYCHDDSCDEGMAADAITNDPDNSLISSTLSSELTDIRETDTGYSSLTFDSPSSEIDKAFECATSPIEEDGDGIVARLDRRTKDVSDDSNKTEDEESEIRSELAEESDLLDLFRDDLTDDEVVATLDETAIKVLQSTDCCSDDDELLALEESEKASSLVGADQATACAAMAAEQGCSSAAKVVVDDDGCVTGAVPRRSLNEIRCSLEVKVNKLRHEKQLVEQKIREAKEAEKIRVQEKRKLQKHVIMHRKQMLLQTLTNLKERLENQSTRLQTSYSAVLSMQRRFAQRQSPLLLISASSS